MDLTKFDFLPGYKRLAGIITLLTAIGLYYFKLVSEDNAKALAGVGLSLVFYGQLMAEKRIEKKIE